MSGKIAKKVRKEARAKAQSELVKNWFEAEKKYKAFRTLLIIVFPLNALLILLNILILFRK